jgi:hypothetical protein
MIDLRKIYKALPRKAKPIVREVWNEWRSREKNKESIEEDIFGNEEEYNCMIEEVKKSNLLDIVEDAKDVQEKVKGRFGGMNIGMSIRCYSLVRRLKPQTVVETGVCNGVSSLFILEAMRRNGSGRLYSVDYPYYSSDSIEKFRDDTYEQFAGAAVPGDKQPGWIVPESLKDRWELKLGKSQRELPNLFCSLDEVNVFIHDSEHSHPCMMFEYEIAWEWLSKGGVIISDDINQSLAFDIFNRVRNTKWGVCEGDLGYTVKV